MAKFNLPANSRVKPGRTYPATEGARNNREFLVYRFDPTSGENPKLDSYQVDLDNCGPMVLDALITIKSEIDPTDTSAKEANIGSSASMPSCRDSAVRNTAAW